LQNSILSIQKSSEEKKEELKDLIKSKSELNHKIEQAKEGMIEIKMNWKIQKNILII